jgi:hypothetical protein
MPMELSRCVECGAKVGGEEHVSVQGTTKVDVKAARKIALSAGRKGMGNYQGISTEATLGYRAAEMRASVETLEARIPNDEAILEARNAKDWEIDDPSSATFAFYRLLIHLILAVVLESGDRGRRDCALNFLHLDMAGAKKHLANNILFEFSHVQAKLHLSSARGRAAGGGSAIYDARAALAVHLMLLKLRQASAGNSSELSKQLRSNQLFGEEELKQVYFPSKQPSAKAKSMSGAALFRWSDKRLRTFSDAGRIFAHEGRFSSTKARYRFEAVLATTVVNPVIRACTETPVLKTFQVGPMVQAHQSCN